MIGDTIYLSGEEKARFFLPREIAESDPEYIKHIYCQGSREHVLSYHLVSGRSVETCSEQNCIINKPRKDKEN